MDHLQQFRRYLFLVVFGIVFAENVLLITVWQLSNQSGGTSLIILIAARRRASANHLAGHIAY